MNTDFRAELQRICAPPMPLMPEDFESGTTIPLAARLSPAQRVAKEKHEKAKRDRHREKIRPEGCITTAETARLNGCSCAWLVARCKKLCIESALLHGTTQFWRVSDLKRVGLLGKVS